MGFFDWLSWGLDWCPVIGEAKAVLELFTGKDLTFLSQAWLFHPPINGRFYIKRWAQKVNY